MLDECLLTYFSYLEKIYLSALISVLFEKHSIFHYLILGDFLLTNSPKVSRVFVTALTSY